MQVTIGAEVFSERLEETVAPDTCAAFRRLLPLVRTLLHVRWSGEWGRARLALSLSRCRSKTPPTAQAGQILLYAGELSEAEILIPYGAAGFACRDRPLSSPN